MLNDNDRAYVKQAFELLPFLLRDQQLDRLFHRCLIGGPNAVLIDLIYYRKRDKMIEVLLSLDVMQIQSSRQRCPEDIFAELVLLTLWLIHLEWGKIAPSPQFDLRKRIIYNLLSCPDFFYQLQNNYMLHFWPFDSDDPFVRRIENLYTRYIRGRISNNEESVLLPYSVHIQAILHREKA